MSTITKLFRSNLFSTACFSTRPSTFFAKSNTIYRIAEQSIRYNPYTRSEQFLKTASIASAKLPAKLRRDLYDFKMHGHPSGYLLIRGLPTDPQLMDTPRDLSVVAAQKATHFSEFWLSTIGSCLGDPFSYAQESGGILYQNIRPDPKKAEKLSSESSKLLLDLHSEAAFHPVYANFLLLFCLRGDRTGQARTIVSSIAAIKNDISPKLNSILRQPLYRTGIDYSFGNTDQMKGNGPVMPILRGPLEDPLLVFDPDLMEGLTNEAQDAILQLKALLDAKKEGVLLEAGDLIIVDNYRALHGRNSFTPFYDGKDRWLQRMLVHRDLGSCWAQLGTKQRVIHYDFSADSATSKITQLTKTIL